MATFLRSVIHIAAFVTRVSCNVSLQAKGSVLNIIRYFPHPSSCRPYIAAVTHFPATTFHTRK